MFMVNFISSHLLFSIFFWLNFMMENVANVIPQFSYHHCYTDVDDYSGYRVVISTNSPHSPYYLRSKTKFVLKYDDMSVQPTSLSTERHLIKESHHCESNVEFSTKNTKFTVLNLNIKLSLDYQDTAFAEFDFQIHPLFNEGSTTLLDKNRLVGLKVKITKSGEEHIKMVSVETDIKDLSIFIMESVFWEGICVVTKNSTGVVLKTKSGELRQNNGFVNGIKMKYTKDDISKESTYPAYPCDIKDAIPVLVVIEEGVDNKHVSFYSKLQPYIGNTLNPLPVTILNKDLVTIDNYDKTVVSTKLYFISGKYNTEVCSESTEILTFVTDKGVTLEAYRSKREEIYPGINGVFWQALLSPPYSCAA